MKKKVIIGILLAILSMYIGALIGIYWTYDVVRRESEQYRIEQTKDSLYFEYEKSRKHVMIDTIPQQI